MGILSQIDAELHKELLEFVKEQDLRFARGEKIVFGEYLLNDLLKQLITGKFKITGTLTDHNQGKIYVEYTLCKDEEKE